MPTLSDLITKLSEEYGVGRRPLRYFDVPKRGELSRAQQAYVRSRFEDIVYRELCVKEDPSNPDCYKKTKSDESPKYEKKKSSYLKAYESLFGPRKQHPSDEDSKLINAFMSRHKNAVKGLVRISVESGVPYDCLKEVYDIGVGAYASSGSRTGMSAEQWGYGRVYAFLMCYFFDEKGVYKQNRFVTNKTDYHIFEKVVDSVQ